MGSSGHGGGDGGALVLAPDPASVGAARRFVADNCSNGSTAEDLRDTAVLLVSELVTNAFAHGRSEVRISVAASSGRVRVEVSDDNSRHPRVVEQDPDALDGQGLAIVDLLSSRWGVSDDRYGKTVWFDLVDDAVA
jgi:anti-sigma regulatory factor (Ser/Thr protein kinase)